MRARRLVNGAATVLAVVAAAMLAVVAAFWFTRDRTPDEFTGRAALASCGLLVQQAVHEEAVTTEERCLYAAMSAGTGAELLVRGMSDEGADIYDYYRAVPGRAGLEVFGDSTRDDFAATDWIYQHCPQARAIDDLGDCVSREL